MIKIVAYLLYASTDDCDVIKLMSRVARKTLKLIKKRNQKKKRRKENQLFVVNLDESSLFSTCSFLSEKYQDIF